jgi:hypothetical protein
MTREGILKHSSAAEPEGRLRGRATGLSFGVDTGVLDAAWRLADPPMKGCSISACAPRVRIIAEFRCPHPPSDTIIQHICLI